MNYTKFKCECKWKPKFWKQYIRASVENDNLSKDDVFPAKY